MIVRIGRRLADERGIALVMAVGILAFMSLTVTGAIYFTSTNQRSSSYAKAEVAAIDFAEAGINNALAVLSDSRNALDRDQPTLIGTPRTNTYSGGSVTWKGDLLEDPVSHALYWLVTSTGRVANPTGPGQAVRRTLTMRVPLKAPADTRPGLEVWNWIYSHRTGNTCDMSILQSVNLLSPLYVRGNLCLRNGAKVARGPLIVGGYLDQQNPQTRVGASGAALTTDVRIGSGCRWSNSGDALLWVTPCRPEPWVPSTKVWVDPSKLDVGGTIPTNALAYPVELPVVYWANGIPAGTTTGWYEYSAPGPYRGCTTSTGTPPVFDTKTGTGAPDGMNNSVPGSFNLTPPSSSYTCVTRNGSITWDHIARKFTIRGTVFIDGSARVENNGGPIDYDGQGVIYLGGTLVIKNTKFCAKVSGTSCDFAGWDPNSTLLIFATYSSGGQISDPTVGIDVVSSDFQGGLYSEWAISCTTTSNTQGPMVSRQEVRVGQTNENIFPKVTILPIGAPGFAPEFYSVEDPTLG